MFTKILTGGFVLIMLGAVVMGSIALFKSREETDAHLGNTARGQAAIGGPVTGSRRGGQGSGQGRGPENTETNRPRNNVPETAPQSGSGGGQGFGRGQGAGNENPTADTTQETIEGIVVETAELVIETDSGVTVQVGLGPSHYREGQGFVLSTGDNVRASGYWQDGEFKAAQLINLDTGAQITLRDASGRPVWAGQGRGQNRG